CGLSQCTLQRCCAPPAVVPQLTEEVITRTTIMPILKRCCCCLDLRAGSLVIGLVSLLFIGVLEIIVGIYSLLNLEEAKKRVKFTNTDWLGILDEGSDIAAIVFFSIVILVATIYIIVCILMIIGVRNKRRFLLLPWIFFTFMNMLMAFSGGILALINSHGYALHIIVGFILLSISSLWIYFTCIVFSFFQALQAGDYW
ncbi:unnamed protein product, partial [Meganyctiphanes norvegica]